MYQKFYRKHSPVLLGFLFLLTTELFGQSAYTLSGTVRSNAGEALPGISILIEGQTKGTVTDIDGRYSLSVNGTETLVLSAIGFISTSVSVNNQNVLDVTLLEDTQLLNEVVVVGYTQQKRSSLVNAVSTVSEEEISKASYNSVLEKIQGQVPGLQITSNSGVPGTSLLVRLRGATSIKAGNEPLYVVDGVFIAADNLQGLARGLGGQTPNPLSDINPDDIESVTVLKDANATAVYGARGANGVILITTKRGARNAPTKVSFSVEQGFARAQNLWELVSGQEHAELVNLVHVNDGQSYETRPFRPENEVIPGYPAFGTPEEQQTYDRVSDIFRTARLQKYNVSLSGGDAKTNFYLGGEYQKQEATLKSQDFARYSFRVNLDHSITSKVKVGTSNTISVVPRTLVRVGDGPAGLFQAALHTPTFYPYYNEDGSYSKPAVFDNHLAILEHADTKSTSLRSINNIYLQWFISPDISFKSSFSSDYNDYRERAYYNTNLVYGQPAGEANEVTTTRRTFIAEQLINYNKAFQRSDLSLFAGNTIQYTAINRLSAVGREFPSDQFKRISSAAVQTAESSGSDAGLLSFFAGANYTYDNRYVIDANVRADASSRFGASNRWGYFPSVGVGWNLTEEAFIPQTNNLNELRLKASFGYTGNQEIEDFAARGLWAGGRNYNALPGIGPTQIANPDLKWETTRQFNVGLTGSLFQRKLDFEVNYYNKYTFDLLLDEPLAPKTGFSTVVRNVGEISNKGYELLLKSSNYIGNGVTWTSTLSFSTNKNKVERLNTPITASYNVFRVEEGFPLYSIWVFNETGLDTETGNAIYEDVNGDGRITVDDKRIIGDVWPNFEGVFRNVFSYKKFDLNLNFFYRHGNSVYNYTAYFLETAGTRGVTRSIQKSSLNYWKNPGDTGVLPRPTNIANPDGSNNYFRDGNSRYFEDASFIRLRDVTLSYQVDQRLLSRLGISQGRVYVTGSNLLLLTSYSGPDPEVNVGPDRPNGLVQGMDFGTPPQPVSVVFGVNVTL